MLRSHFNRFGASLIVLILTSWLVLQPCPALAQQDQATGSTTLTLSHAVQTALLNNPLTHATAAARQLADAQIREASAGRKPLLQVSETFTNSNNPVFVFGTLLEQARFGPNNFDVDFLNHPNPITNFRSAITLRVPLFDQRQTETNVLRAKIGREQADQKTALVEQQLRFEVIRSYYGLLLAESRLQVADEAVRTAEADVKRARDLFETGIVVRADLTAAEVQLSEFRQQRIQTSSDLATAVAALNTAMGQPVDLTQRLSGQLADRRFSLDPLDALISVGLQSRPDYQQALLSIQTSAALSRGARGELQPRVDAFATGGASSRYLFGGSTDYAVGASVTFNLFDAGRKARLEQAQAGEAMAQAGADQLANQIRFEVVRAFQNYHSAEARVAVAAQVTTQAEETLRIVQDRYHAGLTTITELLRAETALVRARTDLLAGRFDQYVGYASVLLATGSLKDVTSLE